MGNQLTARAPSQILSVENYLGDLTNFEFEGNLGSTRFFKVAKARHKEEGTVVIKVFAINDPSLLLKVSAVFVVWTDGIFLSACPLLDNTFSIWLVGWLVHKFETFIC